METEGANCSSLIQSNEILINDTWFIPMNFNISS